MVTILGDRRGRDPMEIGDKVGVDGMTGVVVALPAEGKFAPDHPAEAWAFLKVGALVDRVEAGLIHYSNLDPLTSAAE